MKLYEKHIAPVADTFAYCLLKNHFHLAVRVKSEGEILENKETLTPLRGQVVSSAIGQQPGQGVQEGSGRRRFRKSSARLIAFTSLFKKTAASRGCLLLRLCGLIEKT